MARAVRSDLPRMSVAEFYEWADRQDGAYELVEGVPVPLHPEVDEDGAVRAMAAASVDHGELLANAVRAIDRRRPEGCKVLVGRVGVLTADGTVREPDLVLGCGPRPKGAMEVPNPVLVVEILSPNTSDVDRGQKLDEYKALPAVREVWLVHSTRRAVTVWRRAPERWEAADTIGRGELASEVLAARVPLDELYGDLEV